MRHRKRNRSFNRPKSARERLLQHLSRSLLLKGRIETTVPKAKEARRLTDRLIQFGVRGDLVSYRRALQLLGNAETTSFLFKEVAPLFKSRHGGYTRLFRSRIRPGDGVELAMLELVEKRLEPEKQKKEKKVPSKKEKAKEISPPSGRKEEKPSAKVAEEPSKGKKEKEKPGGFLANLRKFIKPKDRS